MNEILDANDSARMHVAGFMRWRRAQRRTTLKRPRDGERGRPIELRALGWAQEWGKAFSRWELQAGVGLCRSTATGVLDRLVRRGKLVVVGEANRARLYGLRGDAR